MPYGQMPGGLGLLSQLDPQSLGAFFMLASQNPAAFSAIAEAGNLPLPNSDEWGQLFSPAVEEFDSDRGFTANMPPSVIQPQAQPQVRTVPTIPIGPQNQPPAAAGGIGMQTPAGGPPPAVPELPEPDVNATAPTFGSITGVAPQDQLLKLLTGEAGPMAAVGPAAGPAAMAGKQPTTQQRAGQFPAVRMPQQPQPEFRAGITGAQKAPDTFNPTKPGMTPAQALMAALLNRGGGGRGAQAGNPLQALGALLG